MKLGAQHARRNLPDGWQATFGPFRIVPARKQLLLGNRVLRLGGRAFDILQILVEHAGQFVSKQTLFDWAWPNLAVDETNLRTAIAAVRRALRESAMTHDLIETEPGHGYRLAIEVKIDLGGSACAALQTPRSRIVGREATIDGLSGLFPGQRLVTIVGPGGIGKTTTALLTARRLLETRIFDAVSIVDFSSIHDSKLALGAIRSALDLASEIDGDGSAIGAALGRQSRLLLLDNCENVVSTLRIEAPRLLAAAPGVAALATSREPLGAPGELPWRLDPLTVPPLYLPLDPIQALRYSAIELFVERAEAVSASFRLTDENVDQVANICRALDGLPFAIELATGRLESFDIVDLATELRDYFCLHMSGCTRVPMRHRTLRAMLDWSYEALSPHEQILMRRLSVFRGTLTTDTVPDVVADGELRETEIPSLMSALANKSLLNVELKRGLSTYKFLNTTRAYALEKLKVAHEAERYARRHVECVLGLVATAVAEIDPASPKWLEFCNDVIVEIQCAMEWVTGHAAGSALALQLTSSVTPILKALGLVTKEKAKAQVITFGPFRLDRSRRTLYCSEKPVRLGEPSYKVLEALLDRPGETIDNITLIRTVWGSLNVEESNLRHAVAALRKAIADAGCERTYVATVPRRGYRFCEPLSIMAPEVARAEPTPPVRILGRDDFIADLVSDLQGGRLITVVGASGVGKTTVAQCAARGMLSRGHVEHIAFVDLENIQATGQLLPRFFRDLGLGVSYRGWTDVESFLDNRRILIVIDHCDHVINDVADVIEEMLALGPNVRVLCTSREPLHAAGERIRRLDGLRVPEDLKALTASQGLAFPSIQFFVERARVVDPSFTLTDSSTPYIASICSKLDGCPLEIEIAAARTDAFDLPALADVIDGPLRLKMRGSTASRRHRSLEASMDWSFETLALEERLILQRLAVFIGSFTLEAARQITGFGDISKAEVGDVIARLASKSLVASTSNGLHGRRRLAATTRIYAGEKLDRSGERATLARRHATYYAALLISACGNSDFELDCGNDIDQLEAALAWTESPAGDDELHMLLNLGAVRLENRLDLKPKKRSIPPGATSMLGTIPTQDHLAELAAKRLRQEAMSIPDFRSDSGLYTSAFYRDARSSEALIASHCRFGSRGLEGNTRTTMERLWQPG